MRIIYLRAYDFPIGGAAQNRLLGICKGLIEEGHDVQVHQFTPSKLNIAENLLKKQVYNKVFIHNHSWRFSPANTIFKQLIGVIIGVFSSIISILINNRKEKIDYLFINSEKNIYTLIYWLLCKIISAKLGRDLNEYPSHIIFNKKKSLRIKIKERLNYKFFDVALIISRPLLDFYKPLLRKKSRVLLLPVTVDFERFNGGYPKHDSLNITYCGDLSQEKDGVFDLAKAFKMLTNEYPYLKLKLIGENKSQSQKNELRKLVYNLGIEEHVLFKGFISGELIPNELYDSKLLVLSRPANKQAEGGFPTKLGEYLATGIPVVVTRVGDIPFYLKDSESAYLSEPGNYHDFYLAMKRALSNEYNSKSVGLNGKKIALTYFSHKNQGKQLSDFLLKHCYNE
ncbi:MAG: glycosyltransferase family 4 protein [Bacteroidales bacterium]|nr:glycosyltransferase family 4 protein [Bacteroidales bacterium]